MAYTEETDVLDRNMLRVSDYLQADDKRCAKLEAVAFQATLYMFWNRGYISQEQYSEYYSVLINYSIDLGITI